MLFQEIDYENWDRREIREFFRGTIIYMTVQMEISELLRKKKERGFRLYPALIYCAAKVANENPEFRYGYGEGGAIGFWERVDPFYTVPRRDNLSLFSMTATEYQRDFERFHAQWVRDAQRAEHSGRLLSEGGIPANHLMISTVPETSFTSLTFGSPGKDDLTPFLVFGRYYEEGERVLLPVCGEFAHEVNDGAHISCFFHKLESALRNL